MLIEHLEKLRHFYRLTDYRSINEAATKLGISQAGLSKSLASLELELGVKLFVRSKQGLTLTLEGDKTLQAAKRIIFEATRLESELKMKGPLNLPRRFRIGMYDSIAVYFFGDLSAYLRAAHGGRVRIDLTVDSSPFLAAEIGRAELDIAIGVNFDSAEIPGTEFFPLFEDDFSFYVSPKLRGDLKGMPLIIHPRVLVSNQRTLRDELAKLVSRNGAFWVNNFETVKSLAAGGMGIGVLPTRVARPLAQQGQIVLLPGLRPKQFFGRHSIGILATQSILERYREFTMDIYRFGERWAKT